MAKINFIPLGGMDERGKNCYVLEVDNNIYIFNAGVSTPPTSTLGIKSIIPDFSYLEKNKQKIKGIFIGTPSHDNIGSLPFLLTKIIPNIPIYTSAVGKVIIETFMEKRVRNINIKLNIIPMDAMKDMHVGDFIITPFKICNSLPSSFGFVVKTPDGAIVYVDDFIVSFDRNKTFESQIQYINNITRNNTLLLITAVGQAGKCKSYTAPNHKNKEFYDHVVSNTSNRVIVACHDHDAYTVLTLAQVAKQYQRPFIIYSNTFINTFTYLNRNKMFSNKNLITLPLSEISKSKNAIIVITGTQERLFAKIQKIIDGEDDKISFKEADTFVLGTYLVPGYEGYAAKLLDAIARLDVQLQKPPKHYLPLLASDEDHKMLASILQPKFIIPTSGIYKSLIKYENSLNQTWIKKAQIKVLDNGEIIEFNQGIPGKKNQKLKLEEKYLGTQGALDVGASILYERNQMGENGIVTITLLYNSRERKFYNYKLDQIGVLTKNERNHGIVAAAIEKLENTIKEAVVFDANKRLDMKETKFAIKKIVTKFFEKQTNKRPLVLPTIIEVRV